MNFELQNMANPCLVILLSLLLWDGHVNSFSIGRRHERSTDLADALAILQRQRRRVGENDYVSSERLLDNRPLTIEDVSDWLSRSGDHGSVEDRFLEPAWVSDGEFKDFDPSLSYKIPFDAKPVLPQSVKATKQELNDIFNTDTGESNSSKQGKASNQPEKKKKEEMVELKGDKKIITKKSVDMDMTKVIAIADKAEEDLEDNLSMDSLTKEEFRTLMKAMGKLQKQALRMSESKISSAPDAEKVTVIETVEKEGPEKIVTVIQPASDDELSTVFEEPVQPVIKETEVIVESPQGSKTEKIVQEAVVPAEGPAEASKELKEVEKDLNSALASQLESELEDEFKEASKNEAINRETEENLLAKNLKALEHYWVVNKYTNKLDSDQPVLSKRTAKRAANLPASEAQVRTDDDGDDEDDDELAEDPVVGSLVTKIMELQEEVDKLRIVARLEDLENDVLTDALNEATLAQKEGSVTDVEFESLQQAIKLEEALQDLKNEKHKSKGNVVKRGEPWKRRQSSIDQLELVDPQGQKLARNNIDKLIDEENLLKELEDELTESTPEVASLFLDNPENCPAVQSYSTNCELADLYALPVDNEARSLCNIHEMCYACGFSLGVSQDHCDFVYRAAATALCERKENCVLESEIFLRTMKLKTRYIPHMQPTCRSTCTSKFLGMI